MLKGGLNNMSFRLENMIKDDPNMIRDYLRTF